MFDLPAAIVARPDRLNLTLPWTSRARWLVVWARATTPAAATGLADDTVAAVAVHPGTTPPYTPMSWLSPHTPVPEGRSRDPREPTRTRPCTRCWWPVNTTRDQGPRRSSRSRPRSQCWCPGYRSSYTGVCQRTWWWWWRWRPPSGHIVRCREAEAARGRAAEAARAPAAPAAAVRSARRLRGAAASSAISARSSGVSVDLPQVGAPHVARSMPRPPRQCRPRTKVLFDASGGTDGLSPKPARPYRRHTAPAP